MDDIHAYIGNAEIFPSLSHWDFYNHAGVSPLPHPTAQAVIGYANHSEKYSYLESPGRAAVELGRAAAATVLGCDKSEIAFIKSTADGVSIVANAVDWHEGDVIVTTNVEYPTNMYPWMNATRRHGAEVVAAQEQTGPDGSKRVTLESLLQAASRPRVKLLAVSHVEFGSGQRHDLAALGSFCRDHNILFTVDAIQSLGAVPLDVRAMKVDYLAAGGQKWLLSPEGTGIFYCRKELIEKTPPLVMGAWNVVNNMDFEHYDLTFKHDAGRFEAGGANLAGLLGLKCSLDMFNKIGMTAISQRIKSITDRLIASVAKKGYAIGCPRNADEWSGIVSFSSKVHDHAKIAEMLRKEHHVEVAVRHGRIRVSPHFYNSDAQIDRLVDLLPGH